MKPTIEQMTKHLAETKVKVRVPTGLEWWDEGMRNSWIRQNYERVVKAEQKKAKPTKRRRRVRQEQTA